MNYLYGFLSSAFIYSLLHWTFPDRKLDAFIQESSTHRELRQLYSDRWDIHEGEVVGSPEERLSEKHGKSPSSVTVPA